MRSLATAILATVAMLLPPAALAGPASCPDRMVLDRCCGNPEQPDGQRDTPTISGLCCCSFTSSLGIHVDDSSVVMPVQQGDIAMAAQVVAFTVPPQSLSTSVRTTSRARAPPPQTLLSLHVALIC